MAQVPVKDMVGPTVCHILTGHGLLGTSPLQVSHELDLRGVRVGWHQGLHNPKDLRSGTWPPSYLL